MTEDVLSEIPAGRILEEINAQTIAEAWVRVFRRRCPDKWPSVSQVVAGVLAEGRKCGRRQARAAISAEKAQDSHAQNNHAQNNRTQKETL